MEGISLNNERNKLMEFKLPGSIRHDELKKVARTLLSLKCKLTSSPHDYEQNKGKNTNLGQWVRPMSTIRIGKYSIERGFIYIGGILNDINDHYTESSLIDPSLTINEKSPDHSADGVGYWPSYSDISPSSRAAYLEWLASDRSNPETPIAFVFLYFYGLERRLLIDSSYSVVSAEERVELIQELYRLKDIYGGNRSFNGYVNNLLAFVWIQNGGSYKLNNKSIFSKIEFTAVFKLKLAECVNDKKPISSVLALAWIRNHPEINLKTPARRCKTEFDQLFKLRYTQKYGEGLSILPNKTKLKFDYCPASSSLRGYQGIKLDLPDASRLKAPVKKLAIIAEECTIELSSYSRLLGRSDNNRAPLSSIVLLPSELLASINNPIFNSLKQWLTDQLTQSKGVILVNDLLAKFGDERPLKINKKESEMIVAILEKSGFGMAPDIRFHHAKPDIDASIIIFKTGHGEGFIPSHSFNQVGTILRLGSIVAKIDGHVDVAEVSFLEKLIENDEQLNEIEKSSLNAYLHWQLNTPLNMVGLKVRLSTISDREKTAISHILIGVALADGSISPPEVKQLEKLYSSLGLDKSSVLNDIHQISSSKGINKAFARAVEIKEENKQTIQGSQVFSINKELLQLYEEETVGVKGILESIFVDDEYIADELPEEEAYASKEAEYDGHFGLDEAHFTLYQQLVTKEEWTASEVKLLCKNLNLMVEGSFEVINDWAFDKIDASIIEEGNTIIVDLELVKEMTAL